MTHINNKVTTVKEVYSNREIAQNKERKTIAEPINLNISPRPDGGERQLPNSGVIPSVNIHKVETQPLPAYHTESRIEKVSSPMMNVLSPKQ